ncbi:MAG: NAD(P)-dependent oxidoreductase [Dehalococcoidales bacterium]|nr:NAD(P)-dependent oxidoreductase [Dehalococcoidales bacterium]
MIYLVTGGTGLIGLYTVREIAREGGQAVIYSRHPRVSYLERLLSEEERARVKIIVGDVTDFRFLAHTVKENNVDIIIHLAAVLGEAIAANPFAAIKINALGTINLFEIARLLEVKKTVWASSIAVFGLPERYPEEYIPNDAPHYPPRLYGMCKSFNERVADFYFDQYSVDSTALRYVWTYGVEIQEGGVSGSLIRQLMLNPAVGKASKVPYGDATIGWIYAEDAAKLAMLASKVTRKKTGAFTVPGELRSVKEVANYVRDLLPDSDITLLPGGWSEAEKFETSPIREGLGYHSKWTVKQGVRRTINLERSYHCLPPV